MRSVRIATWTSGEPVSLSCVLYAPMRAVFWSFVNATVCTSTRGRVVAISSYQAAVYGDSNIACNLSMLPQNHPAMEKTGGFARFCQGRQIPVRSQETDDRRELRQGSHQVGRAHFDAVLEAFQL